MSFGKKPAPIVPPVSVVRTIRDVKGVETSPPPASGMLADMGKAYGIGAEIGATLSASMIAAHKRNVIEANKPEVKARAKRIFAGFGLGLLAFMALMFYIGHNSPNLESYRAKQSQDSKMPAHFKTCLDKFGNTEAALWCAAPYIQRQGR